MHIRQPACCEDSARRGPRRWSSLRVLMLVGMVAASLLLVGCNEFEWKKVAFWQKEKLAGLFPTETEEALGLQLLWSLPLHLRSRVADLYLLPETLCLMTEDRTFLAIDPRKGYTHWQRDLQREVTVRAAEDEERLYLLAGSRLLAIEKGMGNGRILEERELGFTASSGAVLDSSYFYIGSAEGRLHAVAQGSRLGWQQTVNSVVVSRPQVDSAGVYVATKSGIVYSLSLTDGSREWQFEAGGPVVADLVLKDNTLYVASTDGQLYSLDTALGASRKQQQKWLLPYYVGQNVVQAPVLRDDLVYVVGEHSGVHAVNTATGKAAWKVAEATAFLADDGRRVFLGAKGEKRKSRLLCLDRSSGQLLWDQELPGKRSYIFLPNPHSDLIYIAKPRSGRIYCYRPTE